MIPMQSEALVYWKISGEMHTARRGGCYPRRVMRLDVEELEHLAAFTTHQRLRAACRQAAALASGGAIGLPAGFVVPLGGAAARP